MNAPIVFFLIAHILLVIGAGLGLSAIVGLASNDPPHTTGALALSSVMALLLGLLLRMITRPKDEELELTRRDGLAVVTLGWLSAAMIGALPYVLAGTIPRFIPALFETMSGFTTTGASVLTGLENVPRGILFWRALTHFFGGMGVLVLCVAILPFLGVGGMELYYAEMPGPAKDRLTPRIASTAKILWGFYVFFCAVEAVLLKLGGLSWFDAICHAFATMATGGFSTRTDSVGAFQSVYLETVVVVFMFLAGVNFALYLRLLRGETKAWITSSELHTYALVWALSTAIVTLNVWKSVYPTLPAAFRAAVFHVTSILTTTGFTTQNFDAWPALARFVLFLLMFIGACAGSTGGGIKMIRLYVLVKAVARETRRFMRPQGVFQLRVGNEVVPPEIVSNILTFALLFVLAFLTGTFLMSFFLGDLTTAASSVAATLGNIGPGFGGVGPAANYANVPEVGQAVLIVLMLLGRLELYTVLVLFFPAFWRK